MCRVPSAAAAALQQRSERRPHFYIIFHRQFLFLALPYSHYITLLLRMGWNDWPDSQPPNNVKGFSKTLSMKRKIPFEDDVGFGCNSGNEAKRTFSSERV